MLTKGLDLPRVTLVGVVSADEGLFLPDYRTAERTFQVLTQVAGRAGRGLWGGRVIVQTYHPGHYAIRAAAHHDYVRFYRQEMAFRKHMRYPPFTRLVRLLYTHTQEIKARRAAERLAEDLRDAIVRYGFDDISILGPTPCFFTRLRGQYRWHLILRGRRPRTLLRRFPLPRGWRVDIDPITTL
jgi:Primosomal protein N'' (replication factor Y) - superfamily II helicase